MDQYTVGWICSLQHVEKAMALMDSKVQFVSPSKERYHYSGGYIAGIGVVVAAPCNDTDLNVAEIMLDMLQNFPSVRFRILVGIGGAAPNHSTSNSDNLDDIRLGDIVVSYMRGARRAASAFEYTIDKRNQDFDISIESWLTPPPMVVLRAVEQYEKKHYKMKINSGDSHGRQLERFLQVRYPSQPDQLYESTHTHVYGSCSDCGVRKVVPRIDRQSNEPKLHYGLIALSNHDMRDAKFRDTLRQDEGILCISKQALQLSDRYPTLVITGICDYADSHKDNIGNREWQKYAAATASVYARNLLESIDCIEITKLPQCNPPPTSVDRNPTSEGTPTKSPSHTGNTADSAGAAPPPHSEPNVSAQQSLGQSVGQAISHPNCYIGLLSAEDIDLVLDSGKAESFKEDLKELIKGMVSGFGVDFKSRGEQYYTFTSTYRLRSQEKINLRTGGAKFDGMDAYGAAATCNSWQADDLTKLRAARAFTFISMDYQQAALRFAIYDTVVLLQKYVTNR